jgi:MFS family permease
VTTPIVSSFARAAFAPRQLRRSLQLSVWEGIAAEVVGACSGAAVLTAWALHFHASPLLLGLIVSLSQLAQWLQFPAAWITSTFGARQTAIVAVGASRQVLLPLSFLAFLPCSESTQSAVLLTVAITAALLSVIGNNAWTVWMSELVPQRVRGRYFGGRTAICTAANAVGGLSSGLLLDLARSHGAERLALSGLGLLACVAGAISTWLMCRQAPPRRAHEPLRFRFALIRTPWRDPAARPLLVYQLGWNAAVGLAGSFFTVFMVTELHMGFALVALHTALTAAARVWVAPKWGRVIDEFGAKPVLVFCSFTISVLPLLWVNASPNMMWLVWCDPLLAGVLWGGHAQAIFQLPLKLAPKRERPYYLAAFATAGGLSFAAATSAAGLLASTLSDGVTVGTGHWGRFQLLFLISSLARAAAATLSLGLMERAARNLPVPQWSAIWRAIEFRMPGRSN